MGDDAIDLSKIEIVPVGEMSGKQQEADYHWKWLKALGHPVFARIAALEADLAVSQAHAARLAAALQSRHQSRRNGRLETYEEFAESFHAAEAALAATPADIRERWQALEAERDAERTRVVVVTAVCEAARLARDAAEAHTVRLAAACGPIAARADQHEAAYSQIVALHPAATTGHLFYGEAVAVRAALAASPADSRERWQRLEAVAAAVRVWHAAQTAVNKEHDDDPDRYPRLVQEYYDSCDSMREALAHLVGGAS